MEKLQLSVAIITKNEEENLKKLLPVLYSFVSQIVIVDCGSTDKTIEVSHQFEADVIQQKWLGFAKQKNFALENCKYDWLLLLDADEIPDENMIGDIRKVILNNKYGAYYLKRYTFYLGKVLNYAWQPDKQLRMVHRSSNPEWMGGVVHEYLSANGDRGTLNGKLIHYSYKNIFHHYEKTIYYASLGADKYFSSGRKANIINLIINPLFAFINMYVIRLGILDGWRGLIASFSSMTGTFLKYSMLMERIHK